MKIANQFSKNWLRYHFIYRRVVKELSTLEKEGVIVKVDNTKWCTALVPVVKANRTDIRVYANCKITGNKFLKDYNHPLPRAEDIFAALQRGQHFTKLDLSNAYNQFELDEDTSKLAWSTAYGIFK